MLAGKFSRVLSTIREGSAHSPFTSVSVLCNHFGSNVDLNENLKEFVKKQDFKKNLKEYSINQIEKENLYKNYLNQVATNPRAGMDKQPLRSKNHCLLCHIPPHYINYCNVGLLRQFLHSTGSIIAARETGTCKKHQRQIARCIKHARMTGLIPFELTPQDYEMNSVLHGMSLMYAESFMEKERGNNASVEIPVAAEEANIEEEKEKIESDNSSFEKLMDLLSSGSREKEGDQQPPAEKNQE